MVKDGKDWKKILRAVVFGVVVTFISWILSGNDVSIPLGILVAYLEYRFAK